MNWKKNTSGFMNGKGAERATSDQYVEGKPLPKNMKITAVTVYMLL